MPQIVYYFAAYLNLVAQQAISYGDRVDFVVPTLFLRGLIHSKHSFILQLLHPLCHFVPVIAGHRKKKTLQIAGSVLAALNGQPSEATELQQLEDLVAKTSFQNIINSKKYSLCFLQKRKTETAVQVITDTTAYKKQNMKRLRIITTADADGNIKGYVQEPQTDLPLNQKGKLDVGGAAAFPPYRPTQARPHPASPAK